MIAILVACFALFVVTPALVPLAGQHDGAVVMRIVQVPTRRPGESGRAFIDRMLAELSSKGSASALPPQVHIEPVKVQIGKAKRKPRPSGREWIESQAKALGAKPEPTCEEQKSTLGATKHWPPLPGQRYSGVWPPAALRPEITRDPPDPTLPLDEGQQAWLNRYADKYPNACSPYQKLTVAEAKAREAGLLKVSS